MTLTNLKFMVILLIAKLKSLKVISFDSPPVTSHKKVYDINKEYHNLFFISLSFVMTSLPLTRPVAF